MKKSLATTLLSWILSAFQASRMTTKNESFRLSSWRGVASIGSIALLLTACGDQVTNEVVQDNLTIVSSTKELPKCTKDNEGAEAFVKGETSERICIDGKWTALASSKKDTVVVKEKSSCTTKELKDKSGVKIVCNGDSVGVVLNGKQGEKGDKGDTGAAGKDGTNGKNGTNGASCTVVTLANNAGLKVVCGGDSVGVVLNGEKGDKGDKGDAGKDGTNGKNGTNGSGCTMTQDSKKITITCGDKSSTINLSDIGSSITPDTTVVDSEKVAVSLDSLTGYTQKGPFIKGSTVYLYELMDGRSLKQTNGNFTSNITRDDGRFKFFARDLVSQYVMLVVDGNYRNEVTGNVSNNAIKLKAYSDMRRHATGSVNVNILTHLEFDRVYYLVAHEKMTMKAAKRQAQQEIRKEFHIDLSDNTDAEDLDVFGETDADAALLAVSILLQGDSSETALTTLLTEISNDMAEDGKWNNDLADSIKAFIADWALQKDYSLANYRNNVRNWGLSTTVPYFEKFIRIYGSQELGLGVCGSDSIPLGYVKNVSNPKSIYYAPSYTDTTGIGGKKRFICMDADSARWREAFDIEKDTMGWHPENTKDGTLLEAPVTKKRMVWDNDTLRYASTTEEEYNWGCTSYNEGDSLLVASSKYADYISVCVKNKIIRPVVKRNESLYEKIVDPRDNHEYYTIKIGSQTWFAENLNYEYKVAESTYGNSCNPDSCSVYGRYYTWAAAIDSVAIYKKDGVKCGYGKKKCETTGQIQGICPDGWHLPSSLEWQILFSYAGGDRTAGKKLFLKTNGVKSGDDTYGFTALPAGEYGSYYANNNYENTYVGEFANFWSSTDSDYNYAKYALLYAQKMIPGFYSYEVDAVVWGTGDKYDRYSVRCVKDSE